jgi:hypothetical protein
MGRRLRTGVAAIVLLAAVAACTDRPSAFATTFGAGCVDGTHTADGAAQGPIKAGPLAVNTTHWRGPRGAKFWVGSTRPQPPTSATIVAERLNGPAAPVRVERGVDQIATVAGLQLFYPGLVRLTEPGRWKLTVTIGQDSGCFVVAVA